METLQSILKIGNILLFLIVFMAVALIPMLRTKRETRKLKEQAEKLEKAIEIIEKDPYRSADQKELTEAKRNLAKVNQKSLQ